MDIEFGDRASYDSEKEVHRFYASADGKRIPCKVTTKAMTFGLHVPHDERESREAFDQHREKIDEIASRLIRARRFEKDGSIVIRQHDVR